MTSFAKELFESIKKESAENMNAPVAILLDDDGFTPFAVKGDRDIEDALGCKKEDIKCAVGHLVIPPEVHLAIVEESIEEVGKKYSEDTVEQARAILTDPNYLKTLPTKSPVKVGLFFRPLPTDVDSNTDGSNVVLPRIHCVFTGHFSCPVLNITVPEEVAKDDGLLGHALGKALIKYTTRNLSRGWFAGDVVILPLDDNNDPVAWSDLGVNVLVDNLAPLLHVTAMSFEAKGFNVEVRATPCVFVDIDKKADPEDEDITWSDEDVSRSQENKPL